MIRLLKESEYRLKPILKSVDKEGGGIAVAKSYRLQRRLTIGPFYYWRNYRSTGLINVEDTAEQLENFVEHLTQTIYLSENEKENT